MSKVKQINEVSPLHEVLPLHRVLPLLRDIKLSELLGTELNPITRKVKDHIDDKLEGLVQFEMKEYPDNIFYKKGEIILFRQDLKNEYLRCSYQHYWSFLEKEICLSYSDIQELTRCLVGEHLNCKQFTPLRRYLMKTLMVGEHPNCKQFTPRVADLNFNLLVGEHLNCKQFTPAFGLGNIKLKVGEHLNCKQFTPHRNSFYY